MDDNYSVLSENLTMTPRYQELAIILQREIETDIYPVGTRMPTEMALCERFGVSRFTVREAFRLLVDNGMVTRRQGSGTVVISKNPAILFVQKLSSIEELLQYSTDTFLEVEGTKDVEADPTLAAKLGCNPGELWHKIEGIRYLNKNSPVCWTDVYVRPEHKSLNNLIGKDTTPVFTLLEQEFGLVADKIKIELFAGSMAEQKAWKLGVKSHSPTLVIARSYKDADGRLFEVSVSEHPAGRFTFAVDLTRSLENF